MMNRLLLLPCLVTLACARDPAPADEPDAAEVEAEGAGGEKDAEGGDVLEDPDLGPGSVTPRDDTPDPVSGPDSGTDDDDALPDGGVQPISRTFAALFAEVFEPASCGSPYCHSGAHLEGFGARAFGTWLLTAEAVHSPCNENPRPLVVPFDPEGSLLYLKIAPGLEVCGEKMPNLGPDQDGLPSEQVERVRAWIADGARL